MSEPAQLPPVAATTVRRVLIVEPETLVAAAIRRVVEAVPGLAVVYRAAEYKGIKNVVRSLQPEIGVVDPFDLPFTAPKQRGIPLVGRFHHWSPRTKWIAYVHNAASRHEQNFADSGGYAYVNRRSNADKLEAALKAALVDAPPPPFEHIPETYSALRNRHGGMLPDPAAVLSPRELEIFRLTGAGIKAPELASMLSLHVKTIESHRASLMERLGLDGVVDFYRAAALWLTDHA